MTPLFIGGIGMQEVLLIALVVLLFFGGKKIPELMKGIGKGVRSFKEGMNEVEKEIEVKDTDPKGTEPKGGGAKDAGASAGGAEDGKKE